jgi:hypothetical protein
VAVWIGSGLALPPSGYFQNCSRSQSRIHHNAGGLTAKNWSGTNLLNGDVIPKCPPITVPPPGEPERGPLARSRAGTDIRTAHGLHPVPNHRCRCPTELAGTAAAREPNRRAMAMSREQRRALRLLAAAPNGATEAIMLAHGFTNEMLDTLVRDGLRSLSKALHFMLKGGVSPRLLTETF